MRARDRHAWARVLVVTLLAAAVSACAPAPAPLQEGSGECVEWNAPYEAWQICAGAYLPGGRLAEPPIWRTLGGTRIEPEPTQLVEAGSVGTWADAVADNLLGAVARRIWQLGMMADRGGLGVCPAEGMHSSLMTEDATITAVLRPGADEQLEIWITAVEPEDSPLGGPEDLQAWLRPPPEVTGGWLPLCCSDAVVTMTVRVELPARALAAVADWSLARAMANNDRGRYFQYLKRSRDAPARPVNMRTPTYGASCLPHAEEWTRIHEAGEGWPLPYP